MRLFAATLSALAFATAAAASHAQGAAHTYPHAQASVASTVQSEERCLLAMVALSNSGNDQNAKGFGQAGVIYFTGRLAHDPNFDFGRLKALIGTMDAKEAQAELEQHCLPEFQRSMQQMQAALPRPKSAAEPPAATRPAAPAAPPVQQLPH
jgi:hypothetical protein